MTRIAAGLLFVALASPVAAQEVNWARGTAPAWLGVTYDLRWIQTGSTCASRVLVEGIVPGSPAERAGIRPGDMVVAIDNDRTPARRLQLLSLRLAPGDSVRLLVDRSGAVREVTAVADRRPERPPSLPRPAAAPRPGRDAPVIHLRGDTLMASNLDAWGAAVRTRTPGYWLSYDDGRSAFRALPARPTSDLDRRVVSLLACADTAGSVVPAMRVQAERIQEQAESLRVVIARRALEHREGEARVQAVRPLVPGAIQAVRPLAPGAEPYGGFADAMVFRAEDALAASLRGVMGAEVVAMVPELAAYFRGVDAGLLVVRVAPGSAAHRSGLRPGDVITGAAGRAVGTPPELRAALTTPGADRSVDLAIVRQGRKRVVSVPRP